MLDSHLLELAIKVAAKVLLEVALAVGATILVVNLAAGIL